VSVTEVDTTPPVFVGGEISFSDDYSSVKFSNIEFKDEGTGIDNLYYLIRRGQTTPTSDNITSTSPEFFQDAIEANARYYGWVKAIDKAGNETIQYIGYAVYTQKLWNSENKTIEEIFTYNGAANVKFYNPIAKDYNTSQIVSAVVTATNANSVKIKVSGGTAISGGTSTVSSSWYYAEEDSDCDEYECSNGGRLSGSKCVKLTASQMSYCEARNCTEEIKFNSYIQAYEVYTTYDPMYYGCSSIGGKPWVDSKYYTPAGECPEGYTAGSWRSSNNCPTSTSACTSVNAKMGKCQGFGETTCKWDGDYNAECVDEGEPVYYCEDDSDVLIDDRCYWCKDGTFNRNTKKCTVTNPSTYKYYVYIGSFIGGV